MTASSSDEHAGDDHSDRATPLSGTQLLLARETPPLAILITQDGKKAQSILKILVASDAPAMLSAIGA